MNALKQTWRQLVRRRLWPVALLLVGALAAVPLVLAKPATPAPAEPVAAAAASPAATPAQSYVELTSDDPTTTGKRRRVLGAPKDPFEPARVPKAKAKHASKHTAKAAATATATATPAATATAPPAATGAPSQGTPPAGTAAPAPVKHYPANSVQVRFGKTSGGDGMHKRSLTRLETLPNASSPLIVFMGFAKDGKAAVFMLTGNVTAEGDGSCDPSPDSCETLTLRTGETEFVTFSGTGTKADGEYELDVNDIHATKSASASAAALVAKPTPTATAAPTATATATP